jgi:predicted RNA binding protein YcfA (HicA-like mRNA interferase family)
MATAEKTLTAMRNNPRDWRIETLESVAAAFGVNCRKSGGSHVVFEHPAVTEALSVPARRPIKPIYVQRFVRLMDVVRGSDDTD